MFCAYRKSSQGWSKHFTEVCVMFSADSLAAVSNTLWCIPTTRVESSLGLCCGKYFNQPISCCYINWLCSTLLPGAMLEFRGTATDGRELLPPWVLVPSSQSPLLQLMDRPAVGFATVCRSPSLSSCWADGFWRCVFVCGCSVNGDNLAVCASGMHVCVCTCACAPWWVIKLVRCD